MPVASWPPGPARRPAAAGAKGRTGAPPLRPTGSAVTMATLLAADRAVARRALAVLEPPLQTPAARPGRRDEEADALGLDGTDDGGAAPGGLGRDPVGGHQR